MARRIPEHRFDELVEGAAEVFIDQGYRRTQMSDVAEAVGVAKGTLYTYVESKEALFALCLRMADAERPISLPETLPVPTPERGALSAEIKDQLATESSFGALAAALGQERAEDPRVEADAVIRELWDAMARNARGIKLIDRCMDHPELGPIWQTAGRETARLALARYIETRVASGQFRATPNARLTARIVIETLATWAVHIRWDRAPERFDPDEARDGTIAWLVRGLLA